MKKSIVLLVLVFLGLFVQANNENPLEKMLKAYKIEKVTYGDVSALCISVYKNDISMVKKLIALGEDVNQVSGGKTPLMYAARFNNVEMIKILVANGARLVEKDKNGMTALDYAKLSRAENAAKLLKRLQGKK
ncbi:ankyrin repeat domain-containing protein [Pseudofulvibacter geojedonensis]|uniref:Ankyrin repeat domain-containing protein n=1 Tax=Pseudofulvibacter geojedonensis TaxID=1123758 RepID=A0ABW3I1H7_9FLAO